MKKSNFVRLFGTFLVFSHFGIVLLIMMKSGVDWPQRGEFLMIVGPLFAGFTTVVLKHVFQRRKGPQGRAKKPPAEETSSWDQIVIGFFIPGCLVFSIAYIYFQFANNRDENLTFETAKFIIGSSEVIIAVFVGYIVEGLFGEQIDQNERSESEMSSSEVEGKKS